MVTEEREKGGEREVDGERERGGRRVPVPLTRIAERHLTELV